MTEILRFEMNVPAEVALKHAGPGKPIEGRYGNRVMYTLADNRVMYVAPIVASRITDLGIQPGEVFQVRKQVKRQGQRKLIEWEVQRLPSEPETQLEHELRESIDGRAGRQRHAAFRSARGAQPTTAPAVPECEPAIRRSQAQSLQSPQFRMAIPTELHLSLQRTGATLPLAPSNPMRRVPHKQTHRSSPSCACQHQFPLSSL